ncbi:MAG: 50S ribosomal L9 C-terminal domain-containing protein, partial [Candidatus Caldatribacteriota bacterium]|nr:50S ribosomal L9 C-terminal domain-containing protein [Candidatus Caldatribacteriota bacterium]
IELKESLKKLGTYSIPINLHKGVDAHVKVNLISDSLSEPEEDKKDNKEKEDKEDKKEKKEKPEKK